ESMIILIAWRNIWRNKMRSMVIMLSIAIGLFAGIAVLALYKGMMKSRIRAVIEAEVGHLQLHDRSFKKDYEPRFIINNGGEIITSIAAMPVIKLIAPRSMTNGMLATTTGSTGVQINGVVPEKEYLVSQLKKKIIEGKIFDSTKRNEIMIGKKLAKKMNLKIGSRLVLTFTDTTDEIVSAAFRVTAIYQSDNAPLDEKNVYIQMNELNTLLGTGKAFHEIVLLLKDDDDVNTVQKQLQQTFPGYQVESWKEISPETALLVNTTNQYSYIIMVIIMFALAFGIINTMLMSILERTREIGMMMALGTNKLKIFFLVLLETIFLTLAGTPVGLLIGWLETSYYNKHGLDLSGMGREMMSSFGFGTMVYPEFPADKLAGILIIVTGTAIISCLFPAIKAL
ncbi:MAG TPA: ABC transporter permease, partial [Chitinophagaceae bacterium]|nr:ABC transporter permease [Chitinophagaceae bacterium]